MDRSNQIRLIYFILLLWILYIRFLRILKHSMCCCYFGPWCFDSILCLLQASMIFFWRLLGSLKLYINWRQEEVILLFDRNSASLHEGWSWVHHPIYWVIVASDQFQAISMCSSVDALIVQVLSTFAVYCVVHSLS